MNYESMTDQQINREVASWFYCPNWLSRHAEKLGMIPDYCNDPSAAWPIIVDNGIAIIPTGKFTVWCAMHKPEVDKDNQIHANILEYDSNPLRAAMICFLKMKDAEK